MKEAEHEVRTRKTKMAMTFITFGVLMVIWSLIWLIYLVFPADISGYIYIASGAVISGIAVLAIGMSVGNIGKDANQDEDEAKSEEAAIENGDRKRAKLIKPSRSEV